LPTLWLKYQAMLEFRKDIFADERDDNLVEVGHPTQRQDMLGHVQARRPITTIIISAICFT
jgi:hypothetical protein